MSGEDIRTDEFQIEFPVNALSPDQRELVADRLYEDEYVCEGVLDDDGNVVPRLDNEGNPVLLLLAGTEVGDFIASLDFDESVVQKCWAGLAGEEAA